MSSEDTADVTDLVTALAQRQAEAVQQEQDAPALAVNERESLGLPRVSIVFDDPPRRAAETPPPSAALVREQVQADLLREELERQQIETDNQRNRSRFLRDEQQHIRDYRRKYSGRVYWLTCLWLAFTAALLIASGFKDGPFKLSDAVLVAALGSALAAVIGMFLVILNWLYPKP